jgi:hypothetical protein
VTLAHIYIPNAVKGLPSKTEAAPSSSPELIVAYVEYVHVSHYTPWTGGPNCSFFVNGSCMSHTASGQAWQDWVDRGAACIPEWPFGTRFRLPDGRVFTCVDRGGAIRRGYRYGDGLGWVDLLTAEAGYPFGQAVPVEILQ